MCPTSKVSRVAEGHKIGSSVYLLNCSICKGEFDCRQSWVEHLILDEHQKSAKECLQKDKDGNNVRECSLVIFTTYDLTVEEAGKIIQYFHQYFGRNQTIWVTDFLWWEDRPRIAIIQFESRKKVEQVLREVKSFSDDLIRINNQAIQVKGSLDLLDLEWKAILPGSNPAPIVPLKSLQRSAPGNEARIHTQDDKHQELSTTGGTKKSTKIGEEDVAKLCLEGLEVKERKKILKGNQIEDSPESSSGGQLNICHQFEVISKAIEIPDGKYQQILEIVRSIRDILRKKFPSTKMIIFRNWYLKLKNSSSEIDPLLIYVYAEREFPRDNPPPRKVNINWSSKRKIKRYIKQGSNHEMFSSFPEPRDSKDTRLGGKFIHKPSGFSFRVVNCKETMTEVQCSRLVKYFCEFDPRIRPLFILARYWIITNKIHWGKPEVSAKSSHACLPDPHHLDWMILTFFMWKGYVPSLRTILERPHRILSISKNGIDLGFDADVDFAFEWKREKGFLEFCSTKIFDQGGVIINTKDGEILETEKFLSGTFTSELTPEEIKVLEELQENFDKKKDGCGVDFTKWNWYMIHPLIIHWQCSSPGRKQEVDTIETTKITNERIKKFIKLIEDKGADKAFEICGASLCEILKVDNEVPAIDPILRRSSRKRKIATLENQEENELDVHTSMKIPRKEEPVTGEALNLGRVPQPPMKDENSLAYQFYSLLEETTVTFDSALSEYICKFDWRAYYMIKMTYLWMNLNGLTLGEAGSVKEEAMGLSSLQWLVFFWMSHTKMVPSPGMIGERVIMDTEGGIRVDLGRVEDDKFLEEWREREENSSHESFEWVESSVVSLLHVFKRFLEFYGCIKRREGHCVLNTRLGEVIKKKTLFRSAFGKECKTMTSEELSMLRAQAGTYSFSNKLIYITHPLNLQWRFILRNDIEIVLKLMKKGWFRLRTYLNMKSHGNKDVHKRFKSLRNVFTLSDEDLNNKKKEK